jgi:PadR family transcriptional regulator, regulatory protein PadR
MQHTAIARPRPLIVAHLLLLLGQRPRHGYDVADRLRGWQFDGVTPSMVYRELARLEEDGLVQSFWQASQARGPARHMYELTPQGRDHLARCADDLRGLISHLSDFLVQYAEVGREDRPEPPPDDKPPAPGSPPASPSRAGRLRDVVAGGRRRRR